MEIIHTWEQVRDKHTLDKAIERGHCRIIDTTRLVCIFVYDGRQMIFTKELIESIGWVGVKYNISKEMMRD